MLLVGAGPFCWKHAKIKCITTQFFPLQAEERDSNAEKGKGFIPGKVISALPLVPAATAEKVGPNEASILLWSRERVAERSRMKLNVIRLRSFKLTSNNNEQVCCGSTSY